MISMIQTLPVGNAVRLWLAPSVAPERIRVLRKEVNTFTGWDDPDAMVVMDGLDRAVTDYTGLINGVEVFYMAFYYVSGAWISTLPASATPESTFVPRIVDPIMIVRDRLEQGLLNYVLSGDLQHDRGFIPVLTAAPRVEDVAFPLVTVHSQSDSSDIRALGEEVGAEFFSQADGLWHSLEGTLNQHSLMVVGWSMNADERIALRSAIKGVLLANLPVFDAAGLLQITYSFSDLDDFETYEAPVYQAVCTLSCLAFAAVEASNPPISDVTSTIIN